MSSMGFGCSAAVRRVFDKIGSAVVITGGQAIGTSFGAEGRMKVEE